MDHTTSTTLEGPKSDYRRFFDQSPEMLCLAGFDGWLKDLNPSFIHMLGYDKAEFLAEPFIDFVHEQDRDSTLAGTTKLTEGTDVAAFESRWRRKDGSYCWLSWAVRADFEHQLLYCSARDATEHREQGEVVDKLLRELERSNTDLAQFAYVASHDLSEPLRMVSSYVQLLANRYAGQLDGDADEFIAFAVDGAARMKVLIDDLLSYSRAGGSVAPLRSVDSGVLVQSALADLSRVVADSGATVVVDDLPTVLAEPAQLAQVFQNLLANALKFVAEDVPAEIRVSAERLGQAWCFSVQDNGIGIAPEHRARIFLMLKRLHGRAEYPGTGIGLALCQKIVTRSGGSIWVDDAPGSGSVFRFTLPDAIAPRLAG